MAPKCCPHLLLCTAACLPLPPLVGVGLALRMWPHRHGFSHTLSAKPASRRLEDACRVRDGNVDVQDIKEKGFIVVPRFLSPGEVDAYMALYRGKHDDTSSVSGVVDGGVRGIAPGEIDHSKGMRLRIQNLLNRIYKKTGLYVGSVDSYPCLWIDACRPELEAGIEHAFDIHGHFFHTNGSDPTPLSLPWHQDLEMGFKHPDAYNHLSIYIFLEKPFRGTAGLSLVPYDELRLRSPGLHEVVRGTASRDFKELPEWIVRATNPELHATLGGSANVTLVVGNNRDERFLYNATLQEMACTPEMAPGDAIVFRGDVIHQTQPHLSQPSWRTSMNLRVNPLKAADLGTLLSGGLTKFASLDGNPPMYINRERLAAGRARKLPCQPLFGFRQAWLRCKDLEFHLLSGVLRVSFRMGLLYRRGLWRLRELVAWFRGERLYRYRG